MKRILNEHLLYGILLGLIVAAARFKLDISLITFFLGALIGSQLLLTDYLFQVFLVQPDLEVAKDAKKLVREGKYLDGLKLVYQRRSEISNLTFHTILFQVVFYVFSFFVVTSSYSAFGKGVVLAALLYLLKEQIKEINAQKELNRQWFQRININLTPKEQKIYVGIAVVLFVMYTIIYI
ncbi:hypothetical protein HY345_01055 [Candidatus Microgenomates bacterium]|nr:hypothetical protein [Candidatus Microgenomates bacterium]